MSLLRPISFLSGLILAAGLVTEPARAAGPFQRGNGRGPVREEMRQPQRMEARPQPFQRGAGPQMPQPRFQEQPRFDEPPRFQEPARGPNGSPNDAARRAQQMTGGGRILSVDPNGPGYRVKVLKEGEVRVITVPGG